MSGPVAPLPDDLRMIAALATEIRRKRPAEGAIGFHLPHLPASAPETLLVGAEEIRFALCPSPLAVRAELAEIPNGGALILVTDRTDRELGADVIARLAQRRLHRIEPWAALRERLGVQSIDPRLRHFAWLPEVLLPLSAEGGFRPATQVLEAEEVWQVLLDRVGLLTARPDLRDLLVWTTEPANLAAFSALPPDAQGAHAARLGEGNGGAGAAIVHLALSGAGSDAVAIGLIAEALFSAAGGGGGGGGGDIPLDAESARAVGRLETTLLRGVALDPAAGRAWGQAASELLRTRLAEADGQASAWAESVAEQAERLLAKAGIEPFGARGNWLPAGFTARLARFGAVLLDQLRTPLPERLGAVAAAAEAVRSHGFASLRPADVSGVREMHRLARALATPADAPSGSFEAAVGAYVQAGAFVDRSRAALVDAPLSTPLAPAREALLSAVSSAREGENRRFAEQLAGWFEAEGGTTAEPSGHLPATIPIEQVMSQVAAPLAELKPLLVLVLDGLSFPIFLELADDLAARGWQERTPEGSAGRLAGIALLPSVTEVCRTSLFGGERQVGNASGEKAAFSAHPALLRAGSLAYPPVLFHKGDFGTAGTALAPDVRKAIEDEARRVVGLVVNAVDDQLPKGGQLVPRWSIERIRHLSEILAVAAAVGRAILITADHGHVLERESELQRHEGGGARHRPSGPAGDGEIAVRGPRVLAEGGALVVAWSERLRYSMVQSGYHGGASPQEVVVPLSVWVADDEPLAGWHSAPPPAPIWWNDEPAAILGKAVAAPPSAKGGTTARAKSRGPAEERQSSLFARSADPSATASAGSPTGDWLAALFASPVYAEQLARTGRLGLAEATVAGALEALAERGGSLTLAALARRLEVSEARVHLLVAALQRRLNVEGFAVLAVDPASETVKLDRALLAAQFLGENPAAEEKR